MRAVALLAAIVLSSGVVFADGEKFQQEFALSPSGRAIMVGASGLWLECGIVNEENGEFLLAANFRDVTVEVGQSLEAGEIRVWVPREREWRPKMLVHLFPKMTLRVHCEEEAKQLREGIAELGTKDEGILRTYPRCGVMETTRPEDCGEEFWISNSPNAIMWNDATNEFYIDVFMESGRPDSPTMEQRLGREPEALRQPIVVRSGGVEVRARIGEESEDATIRCVPVMMGTNHNQRRAHRVVILLHCPSEVARWEIALENLRNGGGIPDKFRPNIRTLETRNLLGWCAPEDRK